jgi:ABC-type phosphate transport system substrate-binding protein
MAQRLGFGVLPPTLRDLVLERMHSDLKCEGNQVNDGVMFQYVHGSGLNSLQPLMQKLSDAYRYLQPTLIVRYNSNDEKEEPLGGESFVVSTLLPPTDPQKAEPDVAVLPFMAVGISVLSMVKVVLDGPTLARILEGHITKWLDPEIVALNPDGLWDAYHKAPMMDRDQDIVLLQGPTARSPEFAAIMKQFGHEGQFTEKAIYGGSRYDNEKTLLMMVAESPRSAATPAK